MVMSVQGSLGENLIVQMPLWHGMLDIYKCDAIVIYCTSSNGQSAGLRPESPLVQKACERNLRDRKGGVANAVRVGLKCKVDETLLETQLPAHLPF